MATFQVPQFIEEKAKIIGPLTLRQFFFIAGAFLISVISYNIFNMFFWILITIIVGGAAAALAFIKINGQDATQALLSGLSYMWQPRVYTWQRISKDVDVSDIERIKAVRNTMSIQEKLKSITMNIATGKIFTESKESSGERLQVVTRITGEKVVAKRIDY
ncbi:MAG: PrgI family protein [Candidatus Jorgensenbacteria bacterium]|nr:PrgI family protein [Candidatus Jorgensenbacteria bacterium]